jgi:hypothetical protein
MSQKHRLERSLGLLVAGGLGAGRHILLRSRMLILDHVNTRLDIKIVDLSIESLGRNSSNLQQRVKIEVEVEAWSWRKVRSSVGFGDCLGFYLCHFAIATAYRVNVGQVNISQMQLKLSLA